MSHKQIEEHGNWLVWHDPLPIDWKGADWRYVRKDARDDLDIGTAESKEMCLQTIDWIESQETEEAQETQRLLTDERILNFQNVPLIKQLGAGLLAAQSALTAGGKESTENSLIQILTASIKGYNTWLIEHKGDAS